MAHLILTFITVLIVNGIGGLRNMRKSGSNLGSFPSDIQSEGKPILRGGLGSFLSIMNLNDERPNLRNGPEVEEISSPKLNSSVLIGGVKKFANSVYLEGLKDLVNSKRRLPSPHEKNKGKRLLPSPIEKNEGIRRLPLPLEKDKAYGFVKDSAQRGTVISHSASEEKSKESPDTKEALNFLRDYSTLEPVTDKSKPFTRSEELISFMLEGEGKEISDDEDESLPQKSEENAESTKNENREGTENAEDSQNDREDENADKTDNAENSENTEKDENADKNETVESKDNTEQVDKTEPTDDQNTGNLDEDIENLKDNLRSVQSGPPNLEWFRDLKHYVRMLSARYQGHEMVDHIKPVVNVLERTHKMKIRDIDGGDYIAGTEPKSVKKFDRNAAIVSSHLLMVFLKKTIEKIDYIFGKVKIVYRGKKPSLKRMAHGHGNSYVQVNVRK